MAEMVLERSDEVSQVEAVLERLASPTEAYRQHVATREDVQAIRTEMVGVQAALREDVQAVRTEMVSVQAALQLEIVGVRSELKSEITGVRSELKSEITGVRSELKLEIAGVRSDVQSVKSDMRWMKWLLGVVAAGVLIPLLRDLFGMLP